MRRYAGLVADEAVRQHFLTMILDEFHRTQVTMAELLGGSFDVRRPRMAFTLAIREQPLTVLHEQQLHLLQIWRNHTLQGQVQAAEAIIPDLLVSINAVASGLRTTG